MKNLCKIKKNVKNVIIIVDSLSPKMLQSAYDYLGGKNG